MITWGRDPGPEPAYDKAEDARDRGFDPHPSDLLPPAAHLTLDGEWQAALDASVVEAHQLRDDCGVEDCGNRSCDDCGERMTCTGPEPRACGTTCCDCACSCTTCVHVREDMKAELLRKIEKEGR